MKKLVLLLAIFGIASGACSTQPAASMTTTFIIVRHAEKATDDARDPSLSAAGQARAQALARLLADAPLTATYATGYRRTQQTAQPTAQMHGIVVTTYDARLPVPELALQLRASHANGTVLIVGHSNTVPEIASALSGQTTEAMTDDEFDRLYRVTVDASGSATLAVERY